jgi:sortase (surface protein transpeptidase)
MPPADPSPHLLESRSAPTRVDIPSIGVAAPAGGVGNASNGAIGVPPANKPHLAGWYSQGATPGQPGRTVIVGHLDSKYSGPAVFYDLGALRGGETVTVTRRDGITVVYRVDGASIQPKDQFPADQIYAPSSRSELRLITCGGSFHKETGWSDNIIVYAHMISWHRAPDDEFERLLPDAAQR